MTEQNNTVAVNAIQVFAAHIREQCACVCVAASQAERFAMQGRNGPPTGKPPDKPYECTGTIFPLGAPRQHHMRTNTLLLCRSFTDVAAYVMICGGR